MIDQRRRLTFRNTCLSKSNKSSLFVWVVAAALPAIAPASVIFTNFGPSMSYDTTQGNPVGNDFAGDNAAEGDAFIPTATAKFGSVTVALSCVICSAPEQFTISLTSDSGDSPGSAIESFVFTSATLSALGNSNTPITATSVLTPTLTVGTRYWITVSSSTAYAIAWNDNSTGDMSDQAVSSDGGSTWFAPSGMTPSAFQVDSTVTTTTPEPLPGLLLSAGLLLGLLRSRLSSSRKV